MQVLQPGVGVKYQEIGKIVALDERVDVVFFSRLAIEKGVFDLPKVSSEMKKQKPDVKIVVIGKFDPPEAKAAFEGLVAQYGVRENLVYKGFMEEKTLYATLKAAKVLVYPSRHDAFPLVVLETLAASTPVVAYDIAAIRLNFPADIVKTVPVGDWKAMAAEALKILGNDALRSEVSDRALVFAAKFSWDKVAAEERRVYDGVLKLH